MQKKMLLSLVFIDLDRTPENQGGCMAHAWFHYYGSKNLCMDQYVASLHQGITSSSIKIGAFLRIARAIAILYR